MSIASFPSAVQIQSWRTTMQKELILRSVWEQMSNIVTETDDVPNSKEMKSVPDSVLIKCKSDFDPGSYQLTIPMMGKLNTKGRFGRQKAEGSEEVPQIKYKAVHYNVERKAMSTEEMSVDGEQDKAYKIGSKGTPLLTNYMVELTDFNCHRAIVEGAGWALTETEAWGGPTFASPPQSRKFNPTVMKRGGTALATYSTTAATYEGNIQTYVDSLTTGSNPMNLTGLDALIDEMHYRLLPLKWKQGINFVLLLSRYQARELQDTTSSTSWSALMRNADPREGEKENRAISGILGIYRNTLLIVNPRSPVWNTAGGANTYVGYVKPWSSNAFYNASDATVTRAAKSGAGTGTCEMAIGLGQGAIGVAEIHKASFDEQASDYNFNKGLCVARTVGHVRMDFDIASPTTTSIQNQTSLLYFTPTPSVVY